jgi:hypothetical protein
MRKVRKNATNKIRKVLENTTWEFFHSGNQYRGGEFGKAKHINSTIEDIQLGHAHLFEDGEGKYMVAYAGRCKWWSR